MYHVTIVTNDPVLKKLLQYMVMELSEVEGPVVLLDAAQMERIAEFEREKVILFSSSKDPCYLEAAKKVCAAGFWYLEPSVESLSRVVSGQAAFPEQAPVVYLGQVQSSMLTSRELEVLRELVRGKSDVQIAETLNCSVPTVKHHIQQLRMKTGLANRTQIAVEAVATGLIEKCEAK